MSDMQPSLKFMIGSFVIGVFFDALYEITHTHLFFVLSWIALAAWVCGMGWSLYESGR